MDKDSKIYIAGHRGLVGRHLVVKLKALGYSNLVMRTSKELDLRDNQRVKKFFEKEKIDYVFLLAAKVGGIQANINFPAEYLYDNLTIGTNVIHNAYLSGVQKLLYLGSSCVYPRETEQPMKEEQILTGRFEPTNEGYAIAKVVGLKMCEYYNKQYNTNFISAMPPNLFGPFDNFDPKNSHVLSALIRKIHLAKTKQQSTVTLWGTGIARREFMLTEDLVDGLIFLMEKYNDLKLINIGSGKDIKIKDLALLIADVIEFNGDFQFDTTKPDGMPQKLMDNTMMSQLGWKPKTELRTGIELTYNWLKSNINLLD